MRFNAALCLVVAGSGLWLIRTEGSKWRLKLARFCSVFIFTLAFLTLAEHAFGWDLHIDQLLWKDTWSQSQVGRMAPITAFSFCLAGIFFILFRASRTALVGAAQLVAIVACLTAQWAVLDVIFRSDKGVGIAAPAALALFALSMGMLLTPNHKGILGSLASSTSGGRTLRRMLPAATIAPLVVCALHWKAAQAGLIEEKSAIAAIVVGYSAILVAVTVWTASSSDVIEVERVRLEQEVSTERTQTEVERVRLEQEVSTERTQTEVERVRLEEEVSTEKKQTEQDIRGLNEHLEQRVQERTEELSSANKELEAFAYSVSHDLRAPLRHLDGFLTLLFKRSYSKLDATAQHYIDNTLEASRRMGTLIDDLLQFSRLGRSEMQKTPVKMNEIVEEVRRELQPETHNRIIHWHVGTLPVVAADKRMLRQVIQNLLGNALKFTRPRAQAEIVVGSNRGSNGEFVTFVRDNGVGFDMQYYDKLFQVFQRLHGEDEFEGTGIGLANVRRVVERHGGRVWAEGTVGAGATFYFSLPVAATHGEQHEPIEAHPVS
jgi:signal transduction histidine kinase